MSDSASIGLGLVLGNENMLEDVPTSYGDPEFANVIKEIKDYANLLLFR
jgi:hypothetical protein